MVLVDWKEVPYQHEYAHQVLTLAYCIYYILRGRGGLKSRDERECNPVGAERAEGCRAESISTCHFPNCVLFSIDVPWMNEGMKNK